MKNKIGIVLSLWIVKIILSGLFSYLLLFFLMDSKYYELLLNIYLITFSISISVLAYKLYYKSSLNLKFFFSIQSFQLALYYLVIFLLVIELPFLSIIKFHYDGELSINLDSFYEKPYLLSISTLFLAPIFEEFIYRKLIYDYLSNKNILFICVFSSFIFSASHFFSHPVNLFFLFLMGLLCFHAFYKTKSLFIPIILHFTYNFLAEIVTWTYPMT